MNKNNKGMFRVKIEYEETPLVDSHAKGFKELDDIIFNVKKKLK